MKKSRFVIHSIIVFFSVVYFLLVAVLPITFVIGTTDGGATLQNYVAIVLEFFVGFTPAYLFLLFLLLLLKAYIMYRHSEINREKFILQATIFTILILLQIALVVGIAIWSDHVHHGKLTVIE